jgi:hypothetical protein
MSDVPTVIFRVIDVLLSREVEMRDILSAKDEQDNQVLVVFRGKMNVCNLVSDGGA